MQALPDDSPAVKAAGADGVQQINIAGFCSLKNVVLEPGRLTLLIGPNGAGKSNLLQALRLIPSAAHAFAAGLCGGSWVWCCSVALRTQNNRGD
ncbi:MAG: AAA family ATPase [Synechococcaceae cyanobacterium]|nr:AAA family ATPase [Synechococcaceae cyanobacterium]